MRFNFSTYQQKNKEKIVVLLSHKKAEQDRSRTRPLKN